MSVTLRSLMQLISQSGSERLTINFTRPVANYRAGQFLAINPRSVEQPVLDSLISVLDEPLRTISVYNNMISVDVG